MAFKVAEDRLAELYKNKFHLENDGDTADVIIMYQTSKDALIADAHYIKSPEYSGYVHCLERGCPVCAKGIRIQQKLFIPFYNLASNDLEFFDRSNYFQTQLFNEVFSKYPNPSEFVFRVTRHGAAGSMDTKYTLTAIAKNTVKTFDQICSDLHLTFPEAYALIIQMKTPNDLAAMLSADAPGAVAGAYTSPSASYEVRPRGGSSTPVPPDTEMPPLPDLPPEDFSEDDPDSDGTEDVIDDPPF